MFGSKEDDASTRGKRTAAIPALRPEFDRFLYAPIGEANGELPFSVLSALAGQDLDPWEEAEKLAQLSQASAIARLASMLPQMATLSMNAAPAETAARLVALLPRARRFNVPPIPTFDKLAIPASRDMNSIIIYLIVGGAILLASALFGH